MKKINYWLKCFYNYFLLTPNYPYPLGMTLWTSLGNVVTLVDYTVNCNGSAYIVLAHGKKNERKRRGITETDTIMLPKFSSGCVVVHKANKPHDVNYQIGHPAIEDGEYGYICYRLTSRYKLFKRLKSVFIPEISLEGIDKFNKSGLFQEVPR